MCCSLLMDATKWTRIQCILFNATISVYECKKLKEDLLLDVISNVNCRRGVRNCYKIVLGVQVTMYLMIWKNPSVTIISITISLIVCIIAWKCYIYSNGWLVGRNTCNMSGRFYTGFSLLPVFMWSARSFFHLNLTICIKCAPFPPGPLAWLSPIWVNKVNNSEHNEYARLNSVEIQSLHHSEIHIEFRPGLLSRQLVNHNLSTILYSNLHRDFFFFDSACDLGVFWVLWVLLAWSHLWLTLLVNEQHNVLGWWEWLMNRSQCTNMVRSTPMHVD